MTFITKPIKSVTTATLIHAVVQFDNCGMEKNKRMLVKACSWQLIGFAVMSMINVLYMENWRDGMGLSAVLSVIGLVSYYLHEQIWARVRWGRQ